MYLSKLPTPCPPESVRLCCPRHGAKASDRRSSPHAPSLAPPLTHAGSCATRAHNPALLEKSLSPRSSSSTHVTYVCQGLSYLPVTCWFVGTQHCPCPCCPRCSCRPRSSRHLAVLVLKGKRGVGREVEKRKRGQRSHQSLHFSLISVCSPTRV